MTLAITPNLEDMDSNNCDSAGNWGGDLSGSDTEIFWQGSGSIYWYIPKNSNEDTTLTAATSWDMSGADTHFYIWLMSTIAPALIAKTTGTGTESGIMIRFTDTSSNYVTFHLTGGDIWGGAWTNFVIDISNTSEIFASSGTMDWSVVETMTVYADTSGSNHRSSTGNFWIDAPRFGTGVTITGTTNVAGGAWKEATAICDSVTYKYGVLSAIEGTNFAQGKVVINATDFDSSNEDVKFREDFPEGGFINSGFYEISADTSADITMANGSIKSNGLVGDDVARFIFDLSSALAVDISGMSFSRAGVCTFASGQSIITSVFNNCGQVRPITATFEFNTITDSDDITQGAMLLPLTNNVDNITFNDNNYDAYIVESGTYSDISFSHGTNTTDLHYNNASIATFNTPSDGNTSSITNDSGVMTVVANQVTLLVKVVDDSTGLALPDARVNITDEATKTEILNAECDVNGEASIALDYVSDTDVVGWVREMSLTGTDYTPKNVSGTITSSGLTISVRLQPI